MRAEIARYVRTHLQDPQLGPASIARAYAMSVRTLHALFEDVDASVAGLVRRERLARCLEDLQQPNGGSVTEIAFRWGFCDAAHFSRVFKREFGATPVRDPPRRAGRRVAASQPRLRYSAAFGYALARVRGRLMARRQPLELVIKVRVLAPQFQSDRRPGTGPRAKASTGS